jgi:hypothetical protein
MALRETTSKIGSQIDRAPHAAALLLRILGIPAGTPTILTDVFSGFLLSFQENVG